MVAIAWLACITSVSVGFPGKKRFHGNACYAGYGLTSHSLCVCTLSADPISHCKLQTCPFENKAN